MAARPIRTDARVRPWTDDYASLFQILRQRPAQIDSAFEEAQFEISRNHGQHGDWDGAIDTFRHALQSHPDSSDLQNNLAFLLATCPDTRARNGAQAVMHDERACDLTDYKQATMVSTLAIAYAEAGRIEDANLTIEKACLLASNSGDQELLKRDQELLESYRNRQPSPK